MLRYSILQSEKVCYICGTRVGLHIHEVFFGKNRQKSIKDGCCVYLCGIHHNLSDQGVHFNRDLDLFLKKEMEKKWMSHYNKTIDDFIKKYGKNYL